MTDHGNTSQVSEFDESASLNSDTGDTADITDTTELSRRLRDNEAELAHLKKAIEDKNGKGSTSSSSHSESQLSCLQDFIRGCLADKNNTLSKPVDKFKAAISKNLKSETSKKEEDGFSAAIPDPCVHALD